MIKAYIAEIQKVRRTFTFWFTIIAVLLIPAIFFLVYFFNSDKMALPENINPWKVFMVRQILPVGGLLFHFFAIIVVALNTNIEYKAESWKKLYVLPIRKEVLYWSKLLFLLTQIVLGLFIFFIAFILSGFILGSIYPKLAFTNYSPDLSFLSFALLRLFLSILALVSIQYVISLNLRNMTVPIALGMFLTIMASILIQGWKNVIYFPYAFPNLATFSIIGDPAKSKEVLYYGITFSEWFSLCLFIIIAGAGMFIFKSRTVK